MVERPYRKEKIAALLIKEVGEEIKKEVVLADVLITVSNVIPSPNHQHATVFITVYPIEKAEEVLKEIEKKTPLIQRAINCELKMRPVPKLIFKIDDSEEKARRIMDLLEKIE